MDYKIVYFAFVSANFGGVEQKIIAQFDALLALEAEIHLFLVSSFTPDETFALEIKKRSDVNILINSPEKITNSWARRKEKFDLVTMTLSEFNPKSTLVYFRYPIADFLFLRFLKKNKEYRFITEHQHIENRLRIGIFDFNFIETILDTMYGKAIRNRISGFVGVSSQYLENQLSYLKSSVRIKKHSIVNGNGIDTASINLRSYPYFDSHILKLLFIGSAYKNQGLDRLIVSLENYYKSNAKVEIIVHIVGISFEKKYLKKYLVNPVIRNSFIFHGFLLPVEIDKFANECHLALNSLCVHREGQKVTSTLKSREYFARGIPFVTSSFDDDFNDGNPYILKISGDENPFDFQKLIDFALKLNSDTLHPQKMRQYAIDHLDWTIKMKKLIAFCDKIVEDIH